MNIEEYIEKAKVAGLSDSEIKLLITPISQLNAEKRFAAFKSLDKLDSLNREHEGKV